MRRSRVNPGSVGSVVNRARGEAPQAVEQVEVELEVTVERVLPETPDSSSGLGQSQSQGSSPAL